MKPPPTLTPLRLRADLPAYPPHEQAMRVTAGTVPGPSGYMSSSVLGPSLYVAFTQQLDPTTLLPRDREPALVLDLNRYGLTPGYYTGRLAGTYQSLPLYEVGGSPVTPPLAPSDITEAQVIILSTLSPAQASILANLTPCQLQAVLSLPISQIHTLTSGVLTPTQLSNLVNFASSSEFSSLYTQLTTSQLITLTTALNQAQIWSMLSVLTPQQILTLITNLTQSQLQLLTSLSPADLDYVVSFLTIDELKNLFNTLTPTQVGTLLGLDGADFSFLVTNLTPSKLQGFLTDLTTPQVETLLALTGPQIETLSSLLTTTAQQQNYLNIDPLPSRLPSRVSEQTGTSYTFTADDHSSFFVFSSNSAISATLPHPSTIFPGWECSLWVVGSGNLTLTCISCTIDGESSLLIVSSSNVTIWFDGTNFHSTVSSAVPTGVSQWVRIRKTRADFSAPDFNKDIEIYSLPARSEILGVTVEISVGFTGGSVSSPAMAVGVNSPAYDDLAGPLSATAVGFTTQASTLNLPILYSTSAATSIRARLTATMDTLDHLTTGVVDFWINVSSLPSS